MFSLRSSSGWKKKLDHEVESLNAAHGYREATLSRLMSKVRAPSESLLLEELAGKVFDGQLDVYYRVVSPSTRQPIGRFHHIKDIPDVVLDESTGSEIEVDHFADVETVYVAERDFAR